MKMRSTKATVARAPGSAGVGVVVLAIGIGLMLSDFSLVSVGRVAVVSGIVYACYQRLDQRQQELVEMLKERGQAADEIYRLGYDTGHERGDAEGYDRGLADGHAAARPVVIDLAARRDTRYETGKLPALSSAGSSGDID